MSDFTCPTCAHCAPTDFDPKEAVVKCSECATRIAYGVAAPHVVIEPSGVANRTVTIRLSGVAIQTKSGETVDLADIVVDKPFARLWGEALTSIS
jgi:transcription elongation factor Elf1